MILMVMPWDLAEVDHGDQVTHAGRQVEHRLRLSGGLCWSRCRPWYGVVSMKTMNENRSNKAQHSAVGGHLFR